jgi:hypothetical protein
MLELLASLGGRGPAPSEDDVAYLQVASCMHACALTFLWLPDMRTLEVKT